MGHSLVSMLMVSGGNTSRAFFGHFKPRYDAAQPQAAKDYQEGLGLFSLLGLQPNMKIKLLW